MSRPRVLLADDHTLMMEGLRKLLEGTCELVGTVEDGLALVDAAQRLHPDLILLDISMPLLNGIDAMRRVKKLMPEVKLIFLTVQSGAAYVRRALDMLKSVGTKNVGLVLNGTAVAPWMVNGEEAPGRRIAPSQVGSSVSVN